MKVLICIRNLPYAEPTIHFGGLVAQLDDRPDISLMTVGAKDEDPDAVQARLDESYRLLDIPTAKTYISLGDPLAEILKLAGEEKPDIIVVGGRDLEGIVEALLGTVTVKVVEQARASVLAVRSDRPAVQRVLLPIGGRKMKRRVVRMAVNLARAAGAEVTLLYVTDPVPTMYTGLEAMEERLDELLQTDTPIARHLLWSAQYIAEQGVTGGLKIRQGVVTDEIVRETIDGQYDLVVIGARSMSGPLGAMLMKRVTPRVVEQAACSVLVVR
jgi:nucleotide-binding universal stress UspA family protein